MNYAAERITQTWAARSRRGLAVEPVLTNRGQVSSILEQLCGKHSKQIAWNVQICHSCSVGGLLWQKVLWVAKKERGFFFLSLFRVVEEKEGIATKEDVDLIRIESCNFQLIIAPLFDRRQLGFQKESMR